MLKFNWTRTVTDEPAVATTDPSTRSARGDLRIRNLLDDPRLAAAMTLDLGPAFADAGPVTDLAPLPARRQRPEPVFNRRRLLESDAA